MNMNYFDLVKCIKAFDFDDFDAEVMAYYIDDCIDYPEFDFTYYVHNTALFNVACIKGGRKEALKYIDDNLCCTVEDCIIYEIPNLNGVYLEWY